MAKRLDLIGKLDGKQRTPQGGLRVGANLTRTGIFDYQGPSGLVREYRPAEEVFRADSLETLKLAPLVIGHPDMVRTDNYRQHSVGVVAENVRQDGMFVTADVLVQDAKAIDAVEAGELVELSCGYEVDLDHTPGTTPDGERYDCVQRNIRYNHVGMGGPNWGRAGNQVRLHLDGKGDVVLAHYTPDMSEELQKRLDALQAQFDALKSENEQLRADASSAKASIGNMIDRSEIPALVAARVALESSARAILGPEFKSDGLSDEALVDAALAHAAPSLKLDGRSPEYRRARFDAEVERAGRVDAAHAAVVVASTPTESAEAPPEKSRLDQAIERAEEERKLASQGGAPAGALIRK